MRSDNNKISGFKCFLMILLSNLLTACMSFAPEGLTLKGAEKPAQLITTVESVDNNLLTTFGHSERPVKGSRTESTLSEGTSLVVKTALIDPIIRPASTVKSLYGLTVKSLGGMIERGFINRVRFPILEKKPVPAISNAPEMDLEVWEADLDDITKMQASLGSIRYLVDGDEYFPRLISAINSAEEAIDIRTYIFDNDDVAVEFADHLRARANEVEVKVLVDGLGYLVAGQVDSTSLPANFSPPPSIGQYLKYESKVQLRNQSNPWFTGDHAKITLIDQTTAFVGGMNIGREYRYDWHDLMMEVNGPIVSDLQFEFDKAWAKSGWLGDFAWFKLALNGAQDYTGGDGDFYPVRLLVTNIHNSQIYRTQIEAIRRAQNHIYIQNGYFSDDKILYELARARRRGVDVRVIVSSRNDSGLMRLSNIPTVNRMLKNGIRVYAYPGMNHVKAAVYDGWACLGSANFDKLSLQINQEINLGTSHPEAVQQLLDQVFIPDFAASTELHEPEPLNFTHRFAEFIADEML